MFSLSLEVENKVVFCQGASLLHGVSLKDPTSFTGGRPVSVCSWPARLELMYNGIVGHKAKNVDDIIEIERILVMRGKKQFRAVFLLQLSSIIWY